MSDNKNKYFIVSQVVQAPNKTAAAVAVAPRKRSTGTVTTVAVERILAPEAHALVNAIS